MSDIRINALATTATTPASDDYLALDGSANGTRKILATNIANNVSDVILGASGPSVKSTLSARAPRQGLVFDGTAGVSSTCTFAPGNASTISLVVTPKSDADSYALLSTRLAAGGGAAGIVIYRKSDGKISYFAYAASPQGFDSTATVPINTTAAVDIVFNGSSITYYINGVPSGTSSVSSFPTSALAIQIGSDSVTGGVSSFVGSISVRGIYNRALSASEVVALYESGAPSGADYNSASNTGIVTGAWATYNGSGTVTSTAVDNFNISASGAYNVQCGSSFAVQPGQRIRLNGSFSSLTGSPVAYLYQDNVGAFSASTALTATGAELVATGASASAKVFIGTSGVGTAIGASVSITRLGLLLAPDAAQAGGGLVWYDTSGNAANITLPASGVSWNVPTSGKTATGWSFNSPLLVGTTIDAGYTITARATDASIAAMSADATAQVRLNAQSGLAILETVTNTPLRFRTNSTEAMRLFANGNLFVGASPVDGGQKLQVSGDLRVNHTGSAVIDINSTAAAGASTRFLNSGTVFGYLGSGKYVISNSYDIASIALATSGAQSLYLGTNGTTALTLDSSQNATFAGAVTVQGLGNSSFSGPVTFSSGGDNIKLTRTAFSSWQFGIGTVNSISGLHVTDTTGNTTPISIAQGAPNASLKIATTTGNATFAGSIAINNTVQTAVSVASTHKVTISIGGSTYYLLATNV